MLSLNIIGSRTSARALTGIETSASNITSLFIPNSSLFSTITDNDAQHCDINNRQELWFLTTGASITGGTW
jgi:hypothetical protein